MGGGSNLPEDEDGKDRRERCNAIVKEGTLELESIIAGLENDFLGATSLDPRTSPFAPCSSTGTTPLNAGMSGFGEPRSFEAAGAPSIEPYLERWTKRTSFGECYMHSNMFSANQPAAMMGMFEQATADRHRIRHRPSRRMDKARSLDPLYDGIDRLSAARRAAPRYDTEPRVFTKCRSHITSVIRTVARARVSPEPSLSLSSPRFSNPKSESDARDDDSRLSRAVVFSAATPSAAARRATDSSPLRLDRFRLFLAGRVDHRPLSHLANANATPAPSPKPIRHPCHPHSSLASHASHAPSRHPPRWKCARAPPRSRSSLARARGRRRALARVAHVARHAAGRRFDVSRGDALRRR